MTISAGATNPVRNKNKHKAPGPAGGVTIPLLVIALTLIAVMILAVWFISPGGGKFNQDRLKIQEAQLEQFDRRIKRLEEIDKRLGRLEEEFKDYALNMMDRVESIEKSMAPARDRLDGRLDFPKTERIMTPAPAAQGPDRPAPPAPKTSRPRYHEVKPGDTLYRISLREGISVSELLRINNLKPGAVIHPGQKLLVGPPRR